MCKYINNDNTINLRGENTCFDVMGHAEGLAFNLIFFAQICINKKKLHGVLLSRDNHSTTMQGTVMFIQSEPAARSVHTPLLEASLRVRSLDWRRERLEIDWQRIQPYCGTVEGTRPDTRGYI